MPTELRHCIEDDSVVIEGASAVIEYASKASEDAVPRISLASAKWVVIWTRSNCEQMVHDQLQAKGFEVFLPTLTKWSRRGALQHLLRVPMFPGYLFLHHRMDPFSYVEVRKTRGVVRLLGTRWDMLATVPDQEILSIQKIFEHEVPALPHPYLRAGQRVKVTRGPLRNAEGILVRSEPRTGLLVLSVDLLQRSLAVQIDCTLVAAV